MNLIFEIDRQRLLDGSTGAPIASLQFSYPDKYPVTISITRGNQPHPVTGNVYVTLKPASAPLSPPLALLTIPVNGSATATGILDTYIQEMDDWLPAANKRAAQFEILVVSTTGGTEVSVDVPAQVSRRYNSVDQPGVTVAEKSLASQAEAEAGTNNTKWMSPLRVAQAISHLAEFADTTDELSEGTENLYFTPARAKAALDDELSQIGSDITELGTALGNEETAREAADEAFQSALSAETEARISGDQSLAGGLNTLTTALSSETTARITADSLLGGRIDTLASAVASADTLLGDQISSLAGGLAAEAEARIARDNDLTNEINRVEEAQIAGDSALQTQIDEKVSLGEFSSGLAERDDRIAEVETALTGKSDIGHEHTASDLSDAGQPGGVATLDQSGKVPATQLPSYVDDVLEFTDRPAFPIPGENGKIYIAFDSGKCFRWSGTSYFEVSPSEVTSVAGKTGAVLLDPSDILAYVETPTPSAEPFDMELQKNKRYQIFKTTDDDVTLRLPQLANNGDRVIIRRGAGRPAGVLHIVRQGGQPFLQTIGQLRAPNTVFYAVWAGQWVADFVAPTGFGTAPLTPTSAGFPGDSAYSDPYLYFCVAPNQWRRVPASTW